MTGKPEGILIIDVELKPGVWEEFSIDELGWGLLMSFYNGRSRLGLRNLFVIEEHFCGPRTPFAVDEPVTDPEGIFR